MRLDKYLAHTGFGSRKEVRLLVKKKHVMVNDVIERDFSIILDLSKDKVSVDGQVIEYEEMVYIMMNKPKDYICEHNPVDYPSVLELIHEYRNDLIFVGRLDADTEGLLLITNDGHFSHRVAHGKKDTTKQYYVKLEKDFQTEFIKDLETGIMMDDALLKPAKVELVSEKEILLTISEGKYHQVKRMMHYCDNEVSYLKRMKISSLELDPTLDLGEYRSLTQEEIDIFKD